MPEALLPALYKAASWSQGIVALHGCGDPRRSAACSGKVADNRPDIGADAIGRACRTPAGIARFRVHEHRCLVHPVPGEHIGDIACKRCVLCLVHGSPCICVGAYGFYRTDHGKGMLPGPFPCVRQLRRRAEAERNGKVAVPGFAAGIDDCGERMCVLDHFAFQPERVPVEQPEPRRRRLRGGAEQ
jgi:hypothetical protein